MNNATSTKYLISQETFFSLKSVSLEGCKALNILRLKTISNVKRAINPKTNKLLGVISREVISESFESQTFPLVEISVEELNTYRENGIPSFVLKYNGKLYHTIIPANLSLISAEILGKHQCALPGKDCAHLSAAPDEEGGCEKVRKKSCCIEKYPWILTGYETFATKLDVFVVVHCEHYEKQEPRKKVPISQIDKTKLTMAPLVWEDIQSLDDLRRYYKNKNL